MTKLLAVDPGVRGCGAAIFWDGVLERATYVANPFLKGNGAAQAALLAAGVLNWAGVVNELVVEVPRIYPAARQKGDQNDLIAVAGVAFAVAGRCEPYVTAKMMTTYYPRDWKGTVDADEVMIPRIKGRLSPAEIHRILPVKSSLMHNVYDAIGIGLKKLGRLEPRRIIARGT